MGTRLTVCLAVALIGISQVAAAPPPQSPDEQAASVAAVRKAALVPLAPSSSSRRIQVFPEVAPQLELSEVRTPFSHDLELALGSLWGGRVQVACFQHTSPAIPLVAAPVGKTLPGTLAPRPDWSYGFRLSLHFGHRDISDE
ncbi:MAG: hypothetical protein ACE5IP_00530 [Terriglobia bacterium]